MTHLDKKLKWCLKDKSRLFKTKPDLNLAKKHLKKARYNLTVSNFLESNGFNDWALNVQFYAGYHCLLSILHIHGFVSRNQSCTVSAILFLICEKKLSFDKNLILEFDIIETEETSNNLRNSRESSTYGIKTSIDEKRLKNIKETVLKIYKNTILLIN